MTFGYFKKLKEGFKKLKPWLQKTLPKVAPIVKTITQEVPKYTKNEKVKNILDLTNSGIDVINNANMRFTQFHNTYMEFLVSGGIFELVYLIGIYLFVIGLFSIILYSSSSSVDF